MALAMGTSKYLYGSGPEYKLGFKWLWLWTQVSIKMVLAMGINKYLYGSSYEHK